MNATTDPAFDRAVLTHRPELYATAVRLSRSRIDAEDLLQEAILRAWAFWSRFEAGSNGRAWMHRILLNTFINGYRKRVRERAVLERVQHEPRGRVAQGPDTTAQGLGDEVETALAELPEPYRSAVILVDFQGLSYREVAHRLDCPVGTVMSRLHRGRRVLKRRLRSYATREGYISQAA